MSLEEFISIQMKERYKCFVICGSGLTGKTTLVKKTAEHIGGHYIDLLCMLKQDSQISENITSINPDRLYALIDMEDKKCVFADHLDIVFALWTDTQQREFIRKLDMKSHGTCIVAILHNYKLLGQKGLMKNNSRGMKRIVNIAEID